MQIELTYRGDGFEGGKIVDMPMLLQPGMKLGIVIDDGNSSVGTEWFPVISAGFHLNEELGMLNLGAPLKCVVPITPTDLENDGWTVRRDSKIKPFKK
jgi:hypothetical protein